MKTDSTLSATDAKNATDNTRSDARRDKRSDADNAQNGALQRVAAAPSKILIADGNPNAAPTLPAALREIGHDVLTVASPVRVQSMAQRHKPAIIILGANLPQDGPLTVLHRLRAFVDTAAIPVLAMVPAGVEREDLLAAGVDGCLGSHANNEEIMAAVGTHLKTPHPVTGAPSEILRNPARLAALDAAGLLDTDPDAELDVLTLLASRMLRAPVALVSLVDHRRQFFKSAIGLKAPWDQLRETPASDSFCQWVVSSREGLVISDARTHPVLRNNRAILDLGVIAYLGVPLSAANGETIGSFCAVDDAPHLWNDDELSAMRDLAKLVDAYIALYSPLPHSRPPGPLERHIRAATRAAGRGFFGAARLLRRGRALLGEDDFDELLCLLERHSNRLIDLASEPHP